MKPRTPILQSTRLMDQVRERIRYLHYSLSTEKLYVYWVRFFIRWHGLRHPRDMGPTEVEAFLSMLAIERKVAASTHNQALSALLFLYREVLAIDLPWLKNLHRPSAPRCIPSVLTQSEVATVLAALPADLVRVVASLLYGTGMRLREGLRLRVKDMDFDRQVIVVRQAKGNKDRVVMLPRSLAADLRAQVLAARAQWEMDRQARHGGVDVPHALESKYPGVGQRWGWFWVFPSPTMSADPRSGEVRRHHLHEERLQRALKKAVAAAGIHKPVSVHALRILSPPICSNPAPISTPCRNCSATRTSVRQCTYTHVLKVAAGGTASPLDTLASSPPGIVNGKAQMAQENCAMIYA